MTWTTRFSPLRATSLAWLLALTHALPSFAQVQDTTVTYAYDELGRVTSVDRAQNRKSTLSYDKLGRMQTETVALASGSLLTQMQYDGLSQLSAVTDPRTLTTSYVLDGLGNKASQSSPDTAVSNYSYDEEGNLTSVTDARGKTTTYQYDLLNRLTQAAYQSGTPSSFEYDGGAGGPAAEIGRLTRIADESGSTAYTHDLMGHVLTKVQTVVANAGADVRTVQYSYGTSGASTGHLTSITYPSGARVNYQYDANGRVVAISLNPADGSGGTNLLSEVALLNAIGYAPDGQVTGWTWGDPSLAAVVRAYDLDGRPTSYPVAGDGMLRTLSYNAAALITAYTHGGGANPAQYDQGFGYDLADRLTSFTLGGQTTTYAYDANGNRSQQTGPAGTYTYSGTSNRLNSASVPAPRSYGYDAAGNRTTDGIFTYGYSDRGRLAQINGAGLALNFLYNGIGQRVAKLGGANGAAYYIYDENGRTLGEYTTAGQQSVETVYLGAMPVAVVTPSGQFYVFADHLNAPLTLWSSASAATVWDWRGHDPFGDNAPTLATAALPYFNLRFPGQVADQESGLFYNYFRDYDPLTGRYVESDPIGLRGGVNTYAYVGGNPVASIDSSGLQSIPVPATPPVPAPGAGTPIFPTGPGTSIYPNGSIYPASRPLPPKIPTVDPGELICKLSPVACMIDLFARRISNAICSSNDSSKPGKTPNSGVPGSVHVNPGSGQERGYGSDGLPDWDVDWDHDHGQGVPHGHDWGRGPNGEPTRGRGQPIYGPWPK